MSTTARRDWNRLDDKRAAVIAVIQHVMAQPAHVGESCVKDDNCARQLFEDPAIGNINIPPGVKTIFMPTGELALKAKGSVVIELPPRPADGTAAPPPKPDDLLKFVLCCYNLWSN